MPPAATLAGALPGLAQARELTPLQRLQRVQESGLAESSGAGEPVSLAWRRFLRGDGPSVLVIDATGLDVRARGTAAVLDGAPWLLAEGVLIAAGLRDSREVELRLPGRAERSRSRPPERRRRDPFARPRHHAPHAAGGAARQPPRPVGGGAARRRRHGSIHTPETWCRIALLFAGASGLEASLLTLRRGIKQRGLVELAHSQSLRRADRRLGRWR